MTVVGAVCIKRSMRPLSVLLVSLSLIVACADSGQRGDDVVETDSPWSIGDVRVPMRDGVGLFTDIYLPPGDGPFPVVLTRVRPLPPI